MSKLLVADDDRVVLFTLSEGLREAGFDVIEARDGLQALELCKTQAPELALLDLRMPGLDGLELARRLLAETAVPFLFFSAYNDEEYVQEAVRLGALGYLIKPIQATTLVPMIRTALARAKDIDGLQGALDSNPSIATAVGMLMQSEGLDQASAFDRLRQHARSRRCKLEELAKAMILESNQDK